jgi:hypothetical protein
MGLPLVVTLLPALPCRGGVSLGIDCNLRRRLRPNASSPSAALAVMTSTVAADAAGAMGVAGQSLGFSRWPQYAFSWFDEAAPAPGAVLAHVRA